MQDVPRCKYKMFPREHTIFKIDQIFRVYLFNTQLQISNQTSVESDSVAHLCSVKNKVLPWTPPSCSNTKQNIFKKFLRRCRRLPLNMITVPLSLPARSRTNSFLGAPALSTVKGLVTSHTLLSSPSLFQVKQSDPLWQRFTTIELYRQVRWVVAWSSSLIRSTSR